MKNIVLFVATNLLLLSCTTLYKSGYSVQPVIPQIVTPPVIADLVIDTSKVLQASSTIKVVFGIFKTGDNEFSGVDVGNSQISVDANKVLMSATYKALAGTGNDIIVNPKYIVETYKDLFVKTTTATVSGYGAKIKLSKSKNTFK